MIFPRSYGRVGWRMTNFSGNRLCDQIDLTKADNRAWKVSGSQLTEKKMHSEKPTSRILPSFLELRSKGQLPRIQRKTNRPHTTMTHPSTEAFVYIKTEKFITFTYRFYSKSFLSNYIMRVHSHSVCIVIITS